MHKPETSKSLPKIQQVVWFRIFFKIFEFCDFVNEFVNSKESTTTKHFCGRCSSTKGIFVKSDSVGISEFPKKLSIKYRSQSEVFLFERKNIGMFFEQKTSHNS